MEIQGSITIQMQIENEISMQAHNWGKNDELQREQHISHAGDKQRTAWGENTAKQLLGEDHNASDVKTYRS